MYRLFLVWMGAFLISGCAEKPAASNAAAPIPQQHQIRPIANPELFAGLGEPGTSVPATLGWDIRFAQIHEHQIESLGLRKLFDSPIESSPLIEAEVMSAPLIEVSRKFTNVVLNLSTNVYAGICSEDAATNLLDRFMKSAGVDLLTPPPTFTLMTNLALVSVQSMISVVMATNSLGFPITSNLSLGPHITLRVVGILSNRTVLEVKARLDEFEGYGRPDSKGQPHGPIFSSTFAAVVGDVGPNEALLLGTPTRGFVRRISEKVPRLSDIPVLGQLFVKSRTETNYTRFVFLIRQLPTANVPTTTISMESIPAP